MSEAAVGAASHVVWAMGYGRLSVREKIHSYR